jgi:histidinol-phosphate aminotransferase
MRALGLEPVRSAGNFVYAEVGPERSAAIAQGLLARGVIIRPTGPFGAPGGIRISIGWPDENRRLLDALGEVLAGEA